MSVSSLLRVMVLRDAEAIILETGRVPTLRRRGQAEPLAMPALEAALLDEFAHPLLAGDAFPQSTVYREGDATYPVTIDRAARGLRLVIKTPTARTAPAAPAPSPAGTPAPAAAAPWWASPRPAPSPAPEVRAELPVGDDAAPLCALLAGLVPVAKARGASDLFLSTAQPPHLRVGGRVETIDDPALAIDDAALAAAVAALGVGADAGSRDRALAIAGTRVRINAFVHLGGVAVAARLIRERVPTLAELELPAAELGPLVDHRDGLVLVCGPTGAGKSTTLAALIDLLDQRRAAHVITLEDPIEYKFAPRRCLVHQRELGTHVATFADGLRAALREAPDVILLGELRDRETIAAALTAAETGHLVLATLHAPNATGAIDRVIDAFPENQQRQVRWQLAAVLRCVVTQYLLPRRDGGRAVAVEIVPVTPAVANIMRKGDLHTLPTAIQAGREHGMVPLERSLARLIDSGAVSPQAVKKIAADHDLLAALSGKIR